MTTKVKPIMIEVLESPSICQFSMPSSRKRTAMQPAYISNAMSPIIEFLNLFIKLIIFSVSVMPAVVSRPPYTGILYRLLILFKP